MQGSMSSYTTAHRPFLRRHQLSSSGRVCAQNHARKLERRAAALVWQAPRQQGRGDAESRSDGSRARGSSCRCNAVGAAEKQAASSSVDWRFVLSQASRAVSIAQTEKKGSAATPGQSEGPANTQASGNRKASANQKASAKGAATDSSPAARHTNVIEKAQAAAVACEWALAEHAGTVEDVRFVVATASDVARRLKGKWGSKLRETLHKMIQQAAVGLTPTVTMIEASALAKQLQELPDKTPLKLFLAGVDSRFRKRIPMRVVNDEPTALAITEIFSRLLNHSVISSDADVAVYIRHLIATKEFSFRHSCLVSMCSAMGRIHKHPDLPHLLEALADHASANMGADDAAASADGSGPSPDAKCPAASILYRLHASDISLEGPFRKFVVQLTENLYKDALSMKDMPWLVRGAWASHTLLGAQHQHLVTVVALRLSYTSSLRWLSCVDLAHALDILVCAQKLCVEQAAAKSTTVAKPDNQTGLKAQGEVSQAAGKFKPPYASSILLSAIENVVHALAARLGCQLGQLELQPRLSLAAPDHIVSAVLPPPGSKMRLQPVLHVGQAVRMMCLLMSLARWPAARHCLFRAINCATEALLLISLHALRHGRADAQAPGTTLQQLLWCQAHRPLYRSEEDSMLVVDALTPVVHELALDQVVDTFWALGALQLRPTKLLRSLNLALRASIGSLDAHRAATVLAVFAQFQVNDPDTVGSLARAVRRGVTGLSAIEALGVLSSCAALRTCAPEFITQLYCVVVPNRQRQERLSPEALEALCRAFAELLEHCPVEMKQASEAVSGVQHALAVHLDKPSAAFNVAQLNQVRAFALRCGAVQLLPDIMERLEKTERRDHISAQDSKPETHKPPAKASGNYSGSRQARKPLRPSENFPEAPYEVAGAQLAVALLDATESTEDPRVTEQMQMAMANGRQKSREVSADMKDADAAQARQQDTDAIEKELQRPSSPRPVQKEGTAEASRGLRHGYVCTKGPEPSSVPEAAPSSQDKSRSSAHERDAGSVDARVVWSGVEPSVELQRPVRKEGRAEASRGLRHGYVCTTESEPPSVPEAAPSSQDNSTPSAQERDAGGVGGGAGAVEPSVELQRPVRKEGRAEAGRALRSGYVRTAELEPPAVPEPAPSSQDKPTPSAQGSDAESVDSGTRGTEPDVELQRPARRERRPHLHVREWMQANQSKAVHFVTVESGEGDVRVEVKKVPSAAESTVPDAAASSHLKDAQLDSGVGRDGADSSRPPLFLEKPQQTASNRKGPGWRVDPADAAAAAAAAAARLPRGVTDATDSGSKVH